jgi:predicted site-specific integrase-resolvase
LTEIITLRAAAQVAGVSAMGVLDWCRKYGVGRIEAGRWIIDRDKLQRIINARAVLAERLPTPADDV